MKNIYNLKLLVVSLEHQVFQLSSNFTKTYFKQRILYLHASYCAKCKLRRWIQHLIKQSWPLSRSLCLVYLLKIITTSLFALTDQTELALLPCSCYLVQNTF